MAEEQLFSEHDLIEDGGLTKEELINYFSQLVQEIRNSNSSDVNALRAEIEKLDLINFQVDKEKRLQIMFDCYTQLQNISLKLRRLLSKYMEIANYDSIEYSLYYNGERYAVDHLKPEWLRINSKGALQLQMDKAVDSIKKATVDSVRQEVIEAFNKHYSVFLQAITGTYRGQIGHWGAINKGHIAEAYEEHTEEHHPQAYKVINNLAKSTDELSTADKMIISYQAETNAVSYWANHEGISAAWQHIRNALGTQRGTVAGDVLGRQVKQTTSNARNIRLATLKTLKDGIETYSMILGDTPINEVAEKLANYMGEPIRQTSVKLINNIVDEKVQEMLITLNEISAGKRKI